MSFERTRTSPHTSPCTSTRPADFGPAPLWPRRTSALLKGLLKGLLWAAFMFCFLWASSLFRPAHAAPPNDNFANAAVLSGNSGTLSGTPTATNVDATIQNGEPEHAGFTGGSSVWYTWVAPSNGTKAVNTFGSDFDTLLGVYTGSRVDAITEIASNDQSGAGYNSHVSFTATAGTRYYIAVDGFGGDSGSITLNWASVVPPPNDNFASAATISGNSGTLSSTSSTNNTLATAESGEPLHAGAGGEKSLWYAWTAPADSTLHMDTNGSSFDTVLAIYSGSSLADLVVVGSAYPYYGIGDASVNFRATAGTKYYIAVDGYFGEMGTVKLNWATVTPPSNDDFANAALISGSSGTLSGTPTTTNVNASKESNEPNHGGFVGNKSVWYTWTAPGNGFFQMNTSGSDFDTILGIYTGSSVANLTEIASNGQSGDNATSLVNFLAASGTKYSIAVDGASGDAGQITLNWKAVSPPPNDNFARAATLSGNSGTLSGAMTNNNTNATKEPGEPDHAFFSGGRSVWYAWTAQANGFLEVNTEGSDFNTLLAVYNGSSVDNLTGVAFDEPFADETSSQVYFPVTAGTKYYIAVDGFFGAGQITLNWSFALPTPNDFFAGAAVLSGDSGTLSGTPTTNNTNATKEPGEPDHASIAGGKSLWYVWTAPSDGDFYIDTYGSNFDTILAVYTGSRVDDLTLLTDDDDSGEGTTSAAYLPVNAGTKYYIAVDGYHGETGQITLNWDLVALPPPPPTPPNDDFANAAVLSGNTGTLSGTLTTDNTGATRESGEPFHTNSLGSHSVWFAWTAASNGILKVNTNGSLFDTTLGVYTGNRVDGLIEVASNDDSGDFSNSSVNFRVTTGTKYYIAVDGFDDEDFGLITLNWSFALPPPNDNFTNAAVISGYSGTLSGTPLADNTNATREVDEPFHHSTEGGKSLWYVWTAPSSGFLEVNTIGSDFDTLLGIYTGSSIDGLTAVASNDQFNFDATSLVYFPVTAGTKYYIAVDGYYGSSGPVTLNWSLPQLSIADATVTEGSNTTTRATFKVSLSGAIHQSVIVHYATADGSAKQPADYMAQSGSLTFTPGETTKTFTVAVKGDVLDEDNETFKVNLSGVPNVSVLDSVGIATITDDDSTPQLSIGDTAIIEGSQGQGPPSFKVVTFTVKLSTASGRTVSANAIPSNGTARESRDYIGGGQKLIFSPGETSKLFYVRVISDDISEPEENFFALLSSPVNAGIAQARGICTIKDDDAVPGISVGDISVQEGNFGTRVAAFTLKLSQPSGKIVKVNYATANGSATANVDYNVVPSTQIAFAAGVTTVLARVVIKGDVIDEPGETFKLILGTPINATLTDGQAVCTIVDDDATPNLSIGNVTVVEGNSGTTTLSFPVKLSGKTSQAISVNYATTNGNAGAGSDYVAKTGTLNFAVGETDKVIVVTVNSDRQVEANENFYVLLTNPTNAVIGVGRGTGTITNDDFPPPPPPGVQAPAGDDDSQ